LSGELFFEQGRSVFSSVSVCGLPYVTLSPYTSSLLGVRPRKSLDFTCSFFILVFFVFVNPPSTPFIINMPCSHRRLRRESIPILLLPLPLLVLRELFEEERSASAPCCSIVLLLSLSLFFLQVTLKGPWLLSLERPAPFEGHLLRLSSIVSDALLNYFSPIVVLPSQLRRCHPDSHLFAVK